MDHQNEALKILRRCGEQSDAEIDLAEAALAFAVTTHPNADPAPYRAHLKELAEQVKAAGPAPRLVDQLRLLRRVLVVQNNYQGDEDHYDDLRNANLMQVIDRRRGLPVALGIIYLHVAEAAGWSLAGLNFPGHFLVRLEAAGERAILDPFHAGQTRQPAELRHMLKSGEGSEAELRPEYYTAVSKREVLLRLQNNIKIRHLNEDKPENAITTLQSMILIAPRRHELWRELSMVQAESGNLRSAIAALEVVIDLAAEPQAQKQTEIMLRQLRMKLN